MLEKTNKTQIKKGNKVKTISIGKKQIQLPKNSSNVNNLFPKALYIFLLIFLLATEWHIYDNTKPFYSL